MFGNQLEKKNTELEQRFITSPRQAAILKEEMALGTMLIHIRKSYFLGDFSVPAIFIKKTYGDNLLLVIKCKQKNINSLCM